MSGCRKVPSHYTGLPGAHNDVLLVTYTRLPEPGSAWFLVPYRHYPDLLQPGSPFLTDTTPAWFHLTPRYLPTLPQPGSPLLTLDNPAWFSLTPRYLH